MGMFRSETMQHGTLVLPADRARYFVELLGKSSHMQLIDMNGRSLTRQYKRYIQRIEEMERILRFLFEEINKLPGTTIIDADIDKFLESDHGYQLDRVEEALQKLFQQFEKFRDNNSDLLRQKNAATEERAVIRAAQTSYSSGGGINVNSRMDGSSNTPVLDVEEGGGESALGQASGGLMGFTNIAGVVISSEQEKFSRTIFRATRGNAFTHFESIPEELLDSKTGKPVQKSVFVSYFQGGAGTSALRDKITRICSAYGVHPYEWPKSSSDCQQRLSQVEEIISDKVKALEGYEDFFVSESSALLEVHRPGGGSLIEDYRLFCLKEKAIYSTLNLFEGAETTLRADCWFPEAEEDDIRRLLMSHSTPSQVSAFLLTDKHRSHKLQPPTYIRTTEFTESFQSIVDTYGVPRYKEANPALLTIITFPFLFGIMYGDVGHGLCLLAFGLYLVYKWNQLKTSKDEMVQMIGGGRYLITLMALFAIYAGALYNDFFSLGIDIFGTRYTFDRQDKTQSYYKFDSSRGPYPFGFDPIWKSAVNELLFFNSFKMKFAVIVGGIHMTSGIIIKALNSIYFKDVLTFIFEFIPQLSFLWALVGLMDFLIVYKWATPESLISGQSNKPMIITNIIEMCMLQKPELIAFKGQDTIHKICLFVMIISVPVMLLPKPLIRKCIYASKKKARSARNDSRHQPSLLPNEPPPIEEGWTNVAPEEEEEEDEFDFGDEMIHQMIETIEFCLGAISNTASYLRLWALSLAHQQLSLVFFQKTILLVLQMKVPVPVTSILLFFGFGAFAGLTFAVMLCMDTLECFLHALRLQWVEFQNKFYKADGYAFSPFRFKRVLTADDK